MGYLGTKPANSIVVPELIADGAITNPKIASLAATKLTGIVPDANAPSGSVIQVVQTVKTDAFTTSSQQPTYADVTGLSVSITPSSASNKILVLATFQMQANIATVTASARLVRDSTAIFIGDANGNNSRASAATGLSQTYSAAGSSIVFLDSPATTSSVTYKIQMAKGEGGGVVMMNRAGDDDSGFNRSRTPASITVMEIAG